VAASRRAGAWARGFALLATLRAGSLVHADVGTGRAALPAADRVWMPVTEAAPISVAASGGYGVTESQEGEGAHHRVEGSLAAAAGLTPNIAVSLAFDGHYDMHPGGDTSAVGTPQLGVVAGMHATESIRVGAALQLQVPGRTAPSLDFRALALSLSGLAAWNAGRDFTLAGKLGFRFDQTKNAAPDVSRLSYADRLALGLSDFNAVPFGVAAFQRIAAFELLGELSGEALVGAHAPDLLHSPLRAALGGRWPVASSVVGELLLELSLSQRSQYSRVEPLIPAEPRFSVGLGVRYTPDFRKPAPAPPPPVVAPPAMTRLHGDVSDPDGLRLGSIHVTVRVAGREYSVSTSDDGGFDLDDLPRGRAQVAIDGPGLVPATQQVELDRAEVVLPLQAARAAVSSQLRGLVRSFAGSALPAQVRVLPDAGVVTADKDGRFMLELQAGEYEVEIECAGYLTQHRKISVQDNGVTLLNVELHEVPR
jgi:hypothetical protein